MVYTTPRRVGVAVGVFAYVPTLSGTSHVSRDRSSLRRFHVVPPFTVLHTTFVP